MPTFGEVNFRSLVESAIDGIAVINVAGTIRYINRTFLNMLGHSRSLVGEHISCVYAATESLGADGLGAVLPPEALPWRREALAIDSEGRLVHHELTVSALADGSIMFVANDVSSHLERERNIKRLEMQLLELHQSSFQDALMHELGNSLAAIEGYARMISTHARPEDPGAKHAQAILKSVAHAFGCLPPPPPRFNAALSASWFDLGEMLSAIVKIADSRAPERRIIVKDIPTRSARLLAPVSIISRCLLGALERILEEAPEQSWVVVRLADKATAREPGMVAQALGGPLDTVQEFVEIELRLPSAPENRGVGSTMIAADDPGNMKNAYLDSGALQRLVASKRWSFELQRLEDGGVRLVFAFANASELPSAPQPAFGRNGGKPRTRRRILIVDDNEIVGKALSQLLQEEGFDVDYATTAASVLSQISPDLFAVITDIQMPDMGGRELAERLRAADPDLVIIAHGGANASDLESAVFDAAFPKPSPLKLIKKFLRDRLEAHKADPDRP